MRAAAGLLLLALAGCAAPPVATLIVFVPDPARLESYAPLRNPAVALAFRPSSPDPAKLAAFEAADAPYFFTAASSDYPNYENSPLYVPLETLETVAPRRLCRGFYVHEVMTVESGRRQWNWDGALEAFDWKWMDGLVELAARHGRNVVWSEPSYAWQTIEASPEALEHLARWGPHVVLMFATNFPTQIENCRAHALSLAARFGMEAGESHQAWRFHDDSKPVTRDGSFELAKLEGWDRGARWFQFEGKRGDLDWGSPYMQGIEDFASFLQGAR